MPTNTIDSNVNHGITLTQDAYGNPLTITNTGTVNSLVGDAIQSVYDWTIQNAGSIQGGYRGILMGANASIANTGTITGGAFAVMLQQSGTVDNSGSIGADAAGVLMVSGSLLNEAHGTITGSSRAVYMQDGTVVNDGSIRASVGDGVFLGGVLTNSASGTVYGANKGINAYHATIDNFGSVGAGSYGYGIYLGNFGAVTNEAGGIISGGTGVGLGFGGTVANDGLIVGTDRGVVLGGGGGLTNLGAISGNTGVYIGSAEGSVTNAAGGTIAGESYGIYAEGIATIVNAGDISASDSRSAGVYLLQGGAVTNEAGGTISGAHDGIHAGEYASVVNQGGIAGSVQGIYLADGGAVTNLAGGTISGGAYGVGGGGGFDLNIHNAGVIEATAPDGVGVELTASHSTLENAGTITGADDSVRLEGDGSNLLIIDVGAVFNGGVEATNAGAENTIELRAGDSVGSLNGLGTKYTGFQSVTLDAGAAWDIAGTLAGFNGTTIGGFNEHDRLDLTDLTFNEGETATFELGSDLLTIRDAEGNVLATIRLDGGAGGHLFTLLGDGHGGTFVEESDYAPCYLRGTLIRTPDGDVPVEALGIGHSVATADGGAMPVKWIGRRSYRDWLAVSNADAQPILFKAGSIADGIPARDLYVSPEHAMFLDGMLVPARHLVNGTSIVNCAGMDEIDYFHLEFDRHVVILAEGARAESFVDDESRMLFHNAEEYRRLYPDERQSRPAFCAPRVEGGARLDAIRRTLAKRAMHLRTDGTAAPWGRRGKLEIATRSLVSGWVFSGADAGPVALAILVNGAVVGRVVADRYRADLEAAGIGDGRHGFSFVVPKGLDRDIDPRIEVRREIDWSPLG